MCANCFKWMNFYGLVVQKKKSELVWIPVLEHKKNHCNSICYVMCYFIFYNIYILWYLLRYLKANPPSCSVHGIFQARTLDWVAIPFSSGFSWSRDQTQVSLIASRFFIIWANREALWTELMWSQMAPVVHVIF